MHYREDLLSSFFFGAYITELLMMHIHSHIMDSVFLLL